MNIFEELKTSLEEAVDIKNGVNSPARVTRYEIADVKAVRAQLNVSQAEMAKVLAAIQANPAFFYVLAAQ